MGYYELMYNANGYYDSGVEYRLVQNDENKEKYQEILFSIFYAKKVEDLLLENKLFYKLSYDGIFTDYVFLLGVSRPELAVSKKFKQLLEKYNMPDHQTIPVYIDGTDEILAYIINIYDVFDLSCVDLEKTKGIFHEDGTIEALVPYFKENVIGELDIFSFKDSDPYPRGIYISKRLRKAIKEEGITGCSFLYRDSWYYKDSK